MGTGLSSLLIANRGEIAIRIARAAAEHGLRTVTVHSEDDAAALHTRKSDETRALRGSGPAAYLDAEQIVAVAREAGCDAIHPGYGFLSENAAFARRCAAEGLVFVGPSPEALDVFGDKTKTRALAERSRRSRARGHERPDQPGRGAGLPGRAGRRVGDHAEGDRRRGRARDATRAGRR